jgi:hypothetical protein
MLVPVLQLISPVCKTGTSLLGSDRSWLSGKTLDRDFTFTGDEIMTYMPARGTWFDTRKPHLVTLVRWQKGCVIRGKTTPAGYQELGNRGLARVC